MPFQRGAWLRWYGIPLHAWNESFFKLCVLDCGRYLRTDICSLKKERFDYVSVLVATSSLEIVSLVNKLLIDGVFVEVKIIEEWRFNIGEDACVFKEGDGQNDQSENEDIHVDPDACNNVNTLVEKIVDELEATKLNGMHDHGDAELTNQGSQMHDIGQEGGSPLVSHTACTMQCAIPVVEGVGHSKESEDGCPKLVTTTSLAEGRTIEVVDQVKVPFKNVVMKDVVSQRKRRGSSPPRAGRSSVSRP